MIKEFEGEALDAGLISAAQRVEHYEIAAYGTIRVYASILSENDAIALPEETLREEKETDEKLAELAESINIEVARSEANQEGSKERPTKAKASRG